MEKTPELIPPPAADTGAKTVGDVGTKTESSPAPALAVGNGNNPPVAPKLFGGHPGGKKTLSGFPVDSEEHQAFMRKRDAERKAASRASQRQNAVPPVLPAQSTVTAPPLLSPTAAPVVDSPPPPAGDFVGSPTGEDDFVPWSAGDASPIVAEIFFPLGESLWINRFLAKAIAAKLPPAVIKKMEADAAFNPKGKDMVVKGLAPELARLFNSWRLPVKYKDTGTWLGGFVLIGADCSSKLSARNAVIAEHVGNKPAPTEPPAAVAAQPEKK